MRCDGLITDERPNLISESVLGCRGTETMFLLSAAPHPPARAGYTGAPLSRGSCLRLDP